MITRIDPSTQPKPDIMPSKISSASWITITSMALLLISLLLSLYGTWLTTKAALFALLFCIVGCLFDILDGWYAETYNQITDLGKTLNQARNTGALAFVFLFDSLAAWILVACGSLCIIMSFWLKHNIPQKQVNIFLGQLITFSQLLLINILLLSRLTSGLNHWYLPINSLLIFLTVFYCLLYGAVICDVYQVRVIVGETVAKYSKKLMLRW